MKSIKKIFKWCLFCVPVIALAVLSSCSKNDGFSKGPVSTDTSKPGVITNIRVQNLNGGAYIIYDLPNSNNLLYVLAQYNINDKTIRQTKASYYTDTIKVEGFAASQDYNVTINTVSRANVSSDPVIVKVHPKRLIIN
jgi:hypothetical protein